MVRDRRGAGGARRADAGGKGSAAATRNESGTRTQNRSCGNGPGLSFVSVAFPKRVARVGAGGNRSARVGSGAPAAVAQGRVRPGARRRTATILGRNSVPLVGGVHLLAGARRRVAVLRARVDSQSRGRGGGAHRTSLWTVSLRDR